MRTLVVKLHGRLIVGIFVILLTTEICYGSKQRQHDGVRSIKKRDINTINDRKPVPKSHISSSSTIKNKKPVRKNTIIQQHPNNINHNHKRTAQAISQSNETRSKRQILQQGLSPNIALNPNQNIAFNPHDQILTNQFASNPVHRTGADDELRHRLLLTLENRLQERNLLLHDNEVLRAKELFREKEMNNLLSSHSSFLEGTGGGNSAYMGEPNRKSLMENNALFPQMQRPSDPLLSTNNDQFNTHNLLEQNYMNPIGSASPQQRLLGDEERLLAARNDMPALPNVGNLGDETMPYGSLGLSKSGYIPLGRVDDNQVYIVLFRSMHYYNFVRSKKALLQ